MRIASAAKTGIHEAWRLMKRRYSLAFQRDGRRDGDSSVGHGATSARFRGRDGRVGRRRPSRVEPAAEAPRLHEHDDHDDERQEQRATSSARPRKVIVARSVCSENTPITVPAMLNLPPISEVPPSTTARIA